MTKRNVTIGVVSDTHMPRFGKAVPAVVRETFMRREVELIVHCGDIVDGMAIALFEAIAPVEAVAGNNDPPELVRRLGRKKILEMGQVRLGLVHGDRGAGRSTLVRAQHAFAGERLDAILFGHSHQPYCKRHDGTLLFNPGSPTDRRRERYFSFGVLRIETATITPEIIFFADKSA